MNKGYSPTPPQQGVPSTSPRSTNKFYTFPLNNLTRPNQPLPKWYSESVATMNQKIADNPFDHIQKNKTPQDTTTPPQPPKCNHENVETWKLNQCDQCGLDLGKERLLLETNLSKQILTADEASVNSADENETNLWKRAVRADWLLAFTFDHNCWEWPTWRVVRDIVRPATKKTRCRYSELPQVIHFTGGANIFISHCWSAKWGDLVLASVIGARSNRLVWIDLFAVRQWPGNAADLSFRGVIQRANAMIVSVSIIPKLCELHQINDSEQRLIALHEYFNTDEEGKMVTRKIFTARLWCVVELASAVEHQKPVVVKVGTSCVIVDSCHKRIDNDKTISYSTELSKHMVDVMAFLGDKNVNRHFTIKTEVGKKDEFNLHAKVNFEVKQFDVLTNCQSSECAVKADYEREMEWIKQTCGVETIDTMVKRILMGAWMSHKSNKGISELDAAVLGETDNLDLMLKKKDQSATGGALANCCVTCRDSLFRYILETDEFAYQLVSTIGKYSHALICMSAGAGAVELLRYIIEIGTDLDTLNQPGGAVVKNGTCGEDAFAAACIENRSGVVQLLLDFGILSQINTENWMNICRKSNIDIVDIFLSNGMDVNSLWKTKNQPRPFPGKNPSSVTGLDIACKRGYLKLVQRLLREPNIDVHIPSDGNIPLTTASAFGFLDILDELLKAGSDVNSNIEGTEMTPLSVAAQMNQIKVVEKLLSLPEIDVNKKGGDGITALFNAVRMNNGEIVDILLAVPGIQMNIINGIFNGDCTPRTEIMAAFMLDDTNMSHRLLKCPGIDVNLGVGVDGMDNAAGDNFNPFYYACQCGKVDFIEMLLKEPTLNSKCLIGGLYIACQMNSIQVVKMILESSRSIDVNAGHKIQSGKTFTAIHVSKVHEHEEIVQLLVSYGAALCKCTLCHDNEAELPHCPSDHTLEPFTYSGGSCDVCQTRIDAGTNMLHCHKCNWGLCASCQEK